MSDDERPTVWRGYCRMGDGGADYAEVAARNGYYALGGPGSGGVFEHGDRDSFIAAFVAAHRDGRARAQQVWRLREEARRNDWVLMPSLEHRRVWIGRLAGPSTESYSFQVETEPCPFPHRWRVRWLGSVSYEVARQFCGDAVTGQGALVTLSVQPQRIVDMLEHADNRARGEGGRRFWAIGADPRVYEIERAVATLTSDLWTSAKKPMDVGDGVLIWKFKGNGRTRGVVALGEVIEPPLFQPDADNAYWTDPTRGVEPKLRVRVRYDALPDGPLWLGGDNDDVLADLAVARARGGSVFEVTPQQWDALLARVGRGGSSEPGTVNQAPTRRRQGRGLSKDERDAVERHSMELAIDHYRAAWPIVQDVSSKQSWDLTCRDGDRLFHVEVKGTTTRGEAVIVTRNEVNAARRHRTAMFIVSGIALSRDDRGEVVASGGDVREIVPWVPRDEDLEPLQFNWLVPAEGA